MLEFHKFYCFDQRGVNMYLVCKNCGKKDVIFQQTGYTQINTFNKNE